MVERKLSTVDHRHLHLNQSNSRQQSEVSFHHHHYRHHLPRQAFVVGVESSTTLLTPIDGNNNLNNLSPPPEHLPELEEEDTMGLITKVFSPNEDLGGRKRRPAYINLLKYALLMTTFGAFMASAVLLAYGSSIVEGHTSEKRTPEQIECLKKTWTAFLIMNVVFTLIGVVGIFLEQVCCIFFFMVYSFFVSFGAFFDTVNDNHLFLLLAIPLTIGTFIFLAVVRIERMEPPPPARKYSIYTNAYAV